MLEHEVRTFLHERAKALGGEHRCVKWIGRNHAPDDIVLLPGRHVWIECKRPGKKPRPGQLREHERMREAGCEILHLDTIEKVDAAFPLT